MAKQFVHLVTMMPNNDEIRYLLKILKLLLKQIIWNWEYLKGSGIEIKSSQLIDYRKLK